MSLTAPQWLWLLLVVLALIIGYRRAQRRGTRYTVKLTTLDLLSSVMPRRPAWRRQVPPILLVLAATALIFGLAGPVHQVPGPPQQSISVLAVDVSPSMQATDVSPSRFAAMQSGVRSFIRGLPPQALVGLVSLAGTARIEALPTLDHAQVISRVDHLQLRSFTSLNQAVLASLNAVQATGKPGLPAGIILLSDGGGDSPTELNPVLTDAKSQGVPISTIALGTSRGKVDLGGKDLKVPVNDTQLRHIAKATHGLTFNAASPAALTGIYHRIGHSISRPMVSASLRTEFMGAGLALMLGAAWLSLLWFARMP